MDSKSDNNTRGDINAYYRFVLYGLVEFNITMSIDVGEIPAASAILGNCNNGLVSYIRSTAGLPLPQRAIHK